MTATGRARTIVFRFAAVCGALPAQHEPSLSPAWIKP